MRAPPPPANFNSRASLRDPSSLWPTSKDTSEQRVMSPQTPSKPSTPACSHVSTSSFRERVTGHDHEGQNRNRITLRRRQNAGAAIHEEAPLKTHLLLRNRLHLQQPPPQSQRLNRSPNQRPKHLRPQFRSIHSENQGEGDRHTRHPPPTRTTNGPCTPLKFWALRVPSRKVLRPMNIDHRNKRWPMP